MSVSGAGTTLAKITTGLAVNTPYYLQVVTTSSNPAAPPKNASVLAPASALNAEIVELPASVVSWYKAEGNYLDTFGPNSGTQTGSVPFTAGEVGQAFSFPAPGSNSNMVTATTAGFPIGIADRTVEGWARFDNPAGAPVQTIFSYEKYFVSGEVFSVQILGGVLDVDYFGSGAGLLDTTGAVTAGQLVHFAVTMQSGVLTLYKNGVQVAQDLNPAGKGLNTPTGTTLTIGESPTVTAYYNDGHTSAMEGLVDELTVYNQALTSAQIQAIYTAGASGKQIVAPPTATFTATAASSSEIDLQWTPSTAPDASGYVVTYGTTNPPSGSTQTVSGASPSFPVKVTGLAASTTYYFQVQTITTSGGTSLKAPAVAFSRATAAAGAFGQPSYNSSAPFTDQISGFTQMAVTWDGTHYWDCGGGYSGVNLAEDTPAGGLVSKYSGSDFRSVFTVGGNSAPVYARYFGSNTIQVQTSPGVFALAVTLVGGAIDNQGSVTFNETGSEYISLESGVVYRWNTSGTLIGTVTLAGYGSQTGESGGSIAACHVLKAGGFYLTCANGILSAWNTSGTRVSTAILNGAPTADYNVYSFSYANGMVWLTSGNGNTGAIWLAYNVGL